MATAHETFHWQHAHKKGQLTGAGLGVAEFVIDGPFLMTSLHTHGGRGVDRVWCTLGGEYGFGSEGHMAWNGELMIEANQQLLIDFGTPVDSGEQIGYLATGRVPSSD